VNDTLDDDKLDKLMSQWASLHAASENRLDDLAQRIAARLNELPEPAEMVMSPHPLSRRSFAWAAAAAGAIAASIAILVYVRPFSSAVPEGAKTTVRAGDAIPGVSRLAHFDGRELLEKARLAHAFELEFPGRFAWLLETGEKIQLGLNQEENMRPSRFIAVRIVIESRGADDRDWKPVRTLDFVTLSQETVQASLPSNHGASVAIWTYATADGMISVDSELTLSGPLPVRVSSSRLLSAGAPEEIWQSESDGVKYRVYQAADVLEEGHLG